MFKSQFLCFFCSGRMLPVKPPTGKPAPLVCVYASTGHNSAVLSLCVSDTTMFTGSKGIKKHKSLRILASCVVPNQ